MRVNDAECTTSHFIIIRSGYYHHYYHLKNITSITIIFFIHYLTAMNRSINFFYSIILYFINLVFSILLTLHHFNVDYGVCSSINNARSLLYYYLGTDVKKRNECFFKING